MPTLEEQAREQIDAMLIACGWAIEDYKSSNLGAIRGMALREVPLTSGHNNSVTTRFIELFLRTAKEKLEALAPATAQKNINRKLYETEEIPRPNVQMHSRFRMGRCHGPYGPRREERSRKNLAIEGAAEVQSLYARAIFHGA